jgi:hypothetical protein
MVRVSVRVGGVNVIVGELVNAIKLRNDQPLERSNE